jgi:hypothetical protein
MARGWVPCCPNAIKARTKGKSEETDRLLTSVACERALLVQGSGTNYKKEGKRKRKTRKGKEGRKESKRKWNRKGIGMGEGGIEEVPGSSPG